METRIELESNITHVGGHYRVLNSFMDFYRYSPERGMWKHIGKNWVFYDKEYSDDKALPEDWKITEKIDDEGENIYFDDVKHELRRKSLKPIVDVIVCWVGKKTSEHYKKLIDDNIEVIILSEVLPKLGIDW